MQMIFENLDRLVGPPIFSLIFLAFGYSYMRLVRRGRALSQFQKGMVAYATLFTLGMGYAIAWKEQLAILLGWGEVWILAMIGWGALLGLMAWTRHHYKHPSQPQ
jgi:hypothetical protein